MRTRIISGAVLLALVGLIAWLRGPVLVVAILAAAGIGAAEFYSMTRAGGFRPWAAGGVVLALGLAAPAAVAALGAWWAAQPGAGPWSGLPGLQVADLPARLDVAGLLIAGLGFLLTLLWLGIRSAPDAEDGQGPDRRWVDAGLTLGGALYTGGILRFALQLNRPPGELWWIALIVLGPAAADSGAYFTGRAFGRRKLIPHISPNKTWAGFWGGLVLGVVAVALLAGPMAIPWAHILPLGLLIGGAAVVGDLGESMLKRSFGVKDSSRLIPGHGGLLDRLDSILFVLLVVYGYLQYVYR